VVEATVCILNSQLLNWADLSPWHQICQMQTECEFGLT